MNKFKQWVKVMALTANAFLRTRMGRHVKPRRYRQIFEEIDRIKPKVIVEVGVWNGKRAEEMILRASRYVPVSEVSYYGFDVFETMTDELYQSEISKRPPTKLEVQKKLEATGAKVALFAGLTTNTMNSLQLEQKPDLIFIDGGHEAKTVQNDWEWASQAVGPETAVIFDDYWHNRKDGPKVVIDSIDRGIYNVTIMPETDVFFNKDFGRLVISLARVTRKS
jgi:hypothetical protein